MNRLEEYIEKQEKEISDKQKEIQKIKDLMSVMPDLDYKIDRWSKFSLCSATVNERSTDADIVHSCGCCEDAVLLVKPYILVGDTKVYSQPESFSVGEKSYSDGDLPFPGWRTTLLDAKIPMTIVEKIEIYFGDKKPKHEEE